ncbi:MAG: polysaccharide deacetylase family protein [Anaerolineae bacterium]|nr:polysaccharide deacetylase family protein [Anaerolineae bacterium]
MTANPLLKKLGLSDNDRVVIFHADDIGMCHASYAAYVDLVDDGLFSSAATMVPCGWFPATAVFCREHRSTKTIDIGVHVTLTSEWDNFRWRPVAPISADSGLVDDEGYLHRGCEPVQTQAEVGAVHQEITAQVERALAAGIDVTHMDSHMGCVFHPRLLLTYLQIAQQYQLPALMLRPTISDELIQMFGQVEADWIVQQASALEAAHFPLFDSIVGMPLDRHENRLEDAKQILGELPAGVHYVLAHPSVDTPELRAIAPDWRSRVADYDLFMSEAWRREIERAGVTVVGWRKLRDMMREVQN